MVASFASEIAVFDLALGRAKTVLKCADHIEAPNWTRDGTALIVNGAGRLYRVDLASLALDPIDTGFATACNNDHGLSPDGRLLAISDKTEDGFSTIYTLPAAGGQPVRVTSGAPCYWHGWSPDGRRLAYVARRRDGFQVFTCAVDGAAECQLTRDFDHCDGPDYSADGRWIWFNGELDGAVDLWRVRVDGSGLERMTDDAAVNWFPHPSPDGAHIVYLAYPPGTAGHPFGLGVSLRLLPADGGASRELIRFWGGQGSINVPSWAPDGSRFAFVRYKHHG